MVSGEFAVYLGLDVGKGEHHATALTPAGKKLHDKALPNTELKLRALFAKLAAHGPVLVVVDQPSSIGALPVAVARDCGCEAAYLPGLTMRRLADLHPGESKTDARDAFVIADAARTLPHTLRRVDTGDEALAELEMLVGYDDDLAAESTRVTNRLRGLLLQVHPALERVLGPRLAHPAVLALLETHGSPQALRQVGRDQIAVLLKANRARLGDRLADQIVAALGEQTVIVPGTAAASTILPRLAASLRHVLEQRSAIEAQVSDLLEAHPLSKVLISMPGIGVRTCARILIEIGDGTAFPTAAHLAAYAGLAPVTRRSGSSTRGESPSRRGNKQRKRALFLSAFASLHNPASRAYYQRKRGEGKRHKSALICLARRRVDVIYAMVRDKTFYRTPDLVATP